MLFLFLLTIFVPELEKLVGSTAIQKSNAVFVARHIPFNLIERRQEKILFLKQVFFMTKLFYFHDNISSNIKINVLKST